MEALANYSGKSGQAGYPQLGRGSAGGGVWEHAPTRVQVRLGAPGLN